ncbi:MAG: LemA family protein [Candidatus Diapherotrites archaeon]|nr:LemA family protein [Candidatus Diapherotrites archaeon]
MIWLWILAAVVVIFAIWMIGTYNRFVQLNNAIENTFHQIRVAMKKRFDMINQLVEATSSYIHFEKDVMTDVAKLRNINLNTPADIKDADAVARNVFGKLMAVMENYPDLKSAEVVQQLMSSIKGVEDEIARLRYLYNDQVQSYNMLRQMFPSNIVAGMFGFQQREYLEFGEEIEQRPSAKLY